MAALPGVIFPSGFGVFSETGENTFQHRPPKYIHSNVDHLQHQRITDPPPFFQNRWYHFNGASFQSRHLSKFSPSKHFKVAFVPTSHSSKCRSLPSSPPFQISSFTNRNCGSTIDEPAQSSKHSKCNRMQSCHCLISSRPQLVLSLFAIRSCL